MFVVVASFTTYVVCCILCLFFHVLLSFAQVSLASVFFRLRRWCLHPFLRSLPPLTCLLPTCFGVDTFFFAHSASIFFFSLCTIFFASLLHLLICRCVMPTFCVGASSCSIGFRMLGALVVFFTLHCLLLFACLIHACCVGGLVPLPVALVSLSLFVVFSSLSPFVRYLLVLCSFLDHCLLVVLLFAIALQRLLGWLGHCLG